MQVLQAGTHKIIFLELDPEMVSNIAGQVGFEVRLDNGPRAITLELTTTGRQSPLLLFDASDPGNLGWFSRCQFYVDGNSGAILQTPLTVANQRDRSGNVIANAVKVRIAKELPPAFRLPGRQPVTEQVVYALLYNFLTALIKVGVAVCGGGGVQPLAGRTEAGGPRN